MTHNFLQMCDAPGEGSSRHAFQSWWEKQGRAYQDCIISQGLQAGCVYLDKERWCRRRVLKLHFLEERRGQWRVSVDLRRPSFPCHSWLQKQRCILLPVMTVRKYLHPLANFHLSDRKGDALFRERNLVARRLQFAILAALVNRTADRTMLDAVVGDLWAVTDTDMMESKEALQRVVDAIMKLGTKDDHVLELLSVLRIFSQSILVLVEIPVEHFQDNCDRFLINVHHDSPVRVHRRLGERLGSSPLLIAPRTEYGGNAESYHVEFDPPSDVMVVDSWMIHAYSSAEQHWCDDATLHPPSKPSLTTSLRCRFYGWGVAHPRDATDQPMDIAIATARELCFSRWWGRWHGSADPLSGHVRLDGDRMSPMSKLRESYAVFCLYPQWTTVARYLGVGLAMAVVLGLFVAGLGTGALHNAMRDHAEAVVIVVVTIASLGAGLALYPREHLMTGFVLRPWRHLIAGLFILTVGAVGTSLVHPTRIGTGFCTTWYSGILISAAMLGWVILAWLFLISLRVRKAETTGGSLRWKWTGIPVRRWTHWHRRMPETYGPQRVKRLQKKDGQLTEMVKLGLVDKYLIDSNALRLIDRGLPPATRELKS